ncbi:hypothetical protein Cgig2_023404 [Carnegiea gigantea]|uniref:RNA helicase n=1 Tax=Carnegiea gigantea TaxID=171969 RepID=A0A9Q1QC47_9CARY|nr:hypothetical protein Cgig2_023404 [Carnegiea gigantea]
MKVHKPQLGMDTVQVFPAAAPQHINMLAALVELGPVFITGFTQKSAFWNEMLPTPAPEIHRTNICNNLEIDLDDFKFVDPPPQDNVSNYVHLLWMLGALNDEGSLTKLGHKLEFPFDPTLDKMVLVEHLTLLNICEHFLHVKELRKARKVRSQLVETVQRLNIPLTSCGKAICSAYCQNAAKLKGIRDHVTCTKGTPCHLHPSSLLYGSGCTPDYVLINELILTTTTYIQCTTAVELH